jgi:hypothetical protein
MTELKGSVLEYGRRTVRMARAAASIGGAAGVAAAQAAPKRVEGEAS